MVYIMHGIFETNERYLKFASTFNNTVSLQIQDFSSIRESALSTAPRLLSADAIIAHGVGGLVLYDILQLQLIPPPQYAIFVSVPFQGIVHSTENTLLLNALKLKMNALTARLLAYKLTSNPDSITMRGIHATSGPHLFNTYKSVMDYHMVLTPIAKTKTFICLGGRDTDLKKYSFPYSREIVFNDSGKHVIKDAEQEFTQFINKIGEYQW